MDGASITGLLGTAAIILAFAWPIGWLSDEF